MLVNFDFFLKKVVLSAKNICLGVPCESLTGFMCFDLLYFLNISY